MKYKCLKKNKYTMNDYCLLPLREIDIYQIKKWRNEQLQILRQKIPIDDEEQKKYFEHVVKATFEQDHPQMILFSFVAANQCVGYGGLTNIDWTAKRAEISFLSATEYAQDRKKYDNDFTVFLRLIKSVAFNDLDFNRLYTETYDIRPAHIAVLEKSGFRLEGRQRQHVLIEGEYQDSLIHGLLKRDEESGGEDGKGGKMKAVILTGSSSGLGKALFDILSQKEVYLFSIARRFFSDQEKLAEARSDYIRLINCDLRESNAFDQVKISLSFLSGNNEINEIVFINNAAVIEPLGLIGDLADDAIIAAVNINYLFPVLLTNYLYSIREKRKVKIINISTGAANKGIVGWPLYCSGKAGAKMFFEVLKLQEAEDQDIAVIDFDPGIMDTKMQQKIRNAGENEFPMVKRFIDFKKNGKLAPPEAVARSIVKDYILV